MTPLRSTLPWFQVSRGIFNPSTRPDTCIINYYSEGDCIPPHIDHHDFTRPFVTLSLLSEQVANHECGETRARSPLTLTPHAPRSQNILFGRTIDIVNDGEFRAPFSQPLPVGSVLVLDGNGANVAKHCVPAVSTDRVSITFRKIGNKIRMQPFSGVAR